MCYLLIICDFQTLCPWGTQLTDFLPTKSNSSWEQIHFSSPKPGPHTSEFLYCACKAQDQKPQGRDGPVPRTCSEGGASHILSVSIPVLCFLPEDAQAFPGGVAPSSLHLQPSTAETTFPGRCWPSGPSVPFTLCSDLEQVEKKLLQSVDVFYHSQDLGWMFPSAASSASQRTKSSLSFWISLFHGGSRWSLCPPVCAQKGH